MKKKIRRKLPALFLGIVLLLNVAQTTITWNSDPPPTGSTNRFPPVIRPGQSVLFWAVDLEDLDTKTTFDSTSCTTTTDLVADGSGGSEWCGFDTGTVVDPPDPVCGSAVHGSGTTFVLNTQSWKWPDQGTGDYRSKASASALFIFDDGREDNDPRHDRKLLSASSADKIIPDRVTTEAWGPMYLGSAQYGHSFRHTVNNREFPDFIFEGMGVKEDILLVSCDNPVEPHVSNIIGAANGTWTITDGNCFDECDGHAAGASICSLFAAGNSTVTLFQVYRITSWGWIGKNPNHAIGQQTGFSFSHLQIISFEDISANYTRVTKNGLTGYQGQPVNPNPCGC